MPSLELSMSSMTWIELQFMAALAAEGEARGVSDLREVPELAALAKPVIERALRRYVLRRPVDQLSPVEDGFRHQREFTEYCLRAALWTGERYARRLFPLLVDLADDEVERLWQYVAAVIEADGLGRAELDDADKLAQCVKLGIHRATWPILASIVDAHRVHENGGAEPDYDVLLAPLLAAPLAA